MQAHDSDTKADSVLTENSVFLGDSDMAARMRAVDWLGSPLGDPVGWPGSLRASVTFMLSSRFPMFIAWGKDLTFLYNDAYAAILGDKHPYALARPFEHIWREIWPDISPLIDRAMAGEALWLENLPLRMNRYGHDEDTYFTFSYSPARDDQGAVGGMFCACTETTGQVRAEANLRDLAQSLEQKVDERTAERDRMWETSPDLMLVLDFQGVFLRVNPAWTTVLGYQPEELVNHHVNEFVVPDDHALTEDAYELAATGGKPVIENRYWHKDGSVRIMSWAAAPAGELTYATGRDVTAEKAREAELAQAQDALRQAQKMEAVGQLTGGLAHDFNNLLTGVLGNLELLQDCVARGKLSGIERFITAAQGAGTRAASLTQRLLAFSRRQTLDPKSVDVNRLILDMEDLIRRTVGPHIDIEVVGAAGLWPALVDAGQLENALLNLCINARDAMPEGGRITIETANKWLDGRTGKERELTPGQYLSICVTDNGTGMTADTIARAFDPFFTTKPIGQGTGLGLSMIYGFAKQSGGQVRIYSELGRGTTMCIYLPRHGGEIDETSDINAAASSFAQSRETVLIVDDEPTIRHLVEEVLGGLGHAVIEAGDGPAGLKVLESDARVDLLITDVGLPNGMNGRQVADAARLLRPGLKVLFITGYAENAAVGNGHMEPGMELLTKPFTMVELSRRVNEMLGKLPED